VEPIAEPGSPVEVILRLGGATLVGAVIGFDRELREKPAGLRTHALVSLGAALMTVIGLELTAGWGGSDPGAMTRIIQGVVTGIGFLGGGVILRGGGGPDGPSRTVRNLTTAASIWVAAALGLACGAGLWRTALIALALTLIVLVFGHRLERSLHARLHRDGGDAGTQGGTSG
jgi:putative Mg2+ transporter-C (MgtC) family protein